MNHPLLKLKKEAQQLRLSSAEKAAMHAALMRRVHAGAASAPSARPAKSPYFFMMPQFAMPFAALLMVFFAGGGTLFASGTALPGDPLYSVKTMVSEPIRGVLAFSDEDKIAFHTQIAETRLEEAEVLASQNRLEASAVSKLQTNLDVHLTQREELASKGRGEHDSEDHAYTDELGSSIAAHTEVLAAIGTESSSTTTRENSNSLALAVRNASSRGRNTPQIALMMAKSATPTAPSKDAAADVQPMMMTMSASAPAETEASGNEMRRTDVQDESQNKSKKSGGSQQPSRQEKNALALGKRATSSLEALNASVKDLGKDVSDNARAILDARVAGVAELVASGQVSLDVKDFSAASDSFRQAINEATTLKTFIEANKRFDNGILGRLLGSDDSEREHSEGDDRGHGRGDN